MEAEIKLELTEEVYRGILQQASEPHRVRRQTNIIFDSEDGRLAASRWALRLRLEEDEAFLTVKGPHLADVVGAEFVREENEVSLDLEQARALESGFRLGSSGLAPAAALADLVGDLEVRPRLRYLNERRELRLAGWEVELDRMFDGGHVSYELELETERDRLGEAEAALRSHFSKQGWPFSRSSLSKLERARHRQQVGRAPQGKRE